LIFDAASIEIRDEFSGIEVKFEARKVLVAPEQV
jgi:hypothetical protein